MFVAYVAGPVLSHPALRKRFFLDNLDLTIEALEDVSGPISRVSIDYNDLFLGIVQSDQRGHAFGDCFCLISNGKNNRDHETIWNRTRFFRQSREMHQSEILIPRQKDYES